MIYKFFDKKKESGMNANEEVAEDLLKLVIKKDNLTTVFWQQI